MSATKVITLVALLTSMGVATAAEPTGTGVYVGAELGSASVTTSVQTPTLPQPNPSGHTLGWGLFAGVRPGRYIGAEINYTDFGKVNVHNITDGLGNITYEASGEQDAFGINFVGYLPLPNSWDLFGKVGYADLTTKTAYNGDYPNEFVCTGPPRTLCVPIGMASGSQTRHSGDFAWGFGAQYHFNSMSLRAEYQRIDGGNNGSPELWSLGVAWHF